MELKVDFEPLVREALSETFKDEFKDIMREAIKKEVTQVFYSKAIRKGTREFIVEVLNTIAREFRVDVEGAVKEIKQDVDIQKEIKNSLVRSIENLSSDVFEDAILSFIRDKIDS